MVFDIPFNIFALYIAMATTIGIIGVIMGVKKIDGAPFVCIFAGGMMFVLIVLVGNIEVDYYENPVYVRAYPMNVTTGSTSITTNATFFGIAEKVNTVTSKLYNANVSCITIDLLKTGSPTGNVQLGVFDSNNNVIKAFGNFSTSEISSSAQRSYTKCLSSHDYYILQLGDRIGVKYVSGDASNNIKAYRHTSDTFDTTQSVRSYFSTSWSDTTTDDVRIILATDELELSPQAIKHQFNKYETWAFMIVMAAFWLIFGAILQIRNT